MSHSLQVHELHSPWSSPGQNPGVGSLSLLQGSSQPRDGTRVSCIAGRFFTSWVTGKPSYEKQLYFPKETVASLYISINLVNGQLDVRWLYILIATSYFNLLWFAFRLKHMKKIWFHVFSCKTKEKCSSLGVIFLWHYTKTPQVVISSKVSCNVEKETVLMSLSNTLISESIGVPCTPNPSFPGISHLENTGLLNYEDH